MKANVIHVDLNPCGGAEQLAIATLQSLLEMGLQVDLTVAKMPHIDRIEKAFGASVRSIFDHVNIKPLGRLPIEVDLQTGALVCRKGTESAMQEYSVIVNTHGDILPYYLPHFSTKKCITYCHFPVVADYVKERNLDYLQALAGLGLLDKRSVRAAVDDGTLFWRSFLEYYLLMIRNSLIATNSDFSRKAIHMALRNGVSKTANEPAIIAPPVCVNDFRQDGGCSSSSADNIPITNPVGSEPRLDSTLVVSRIHPSKKLENAIDLACILNQKKIGTGMVIAGNLSIDDRTGQKYYLHLLDMITDCGLSDYVRIKVNVELGKLRSFMHRSKVYFHPMPEEPFGISVVEAMAAGLVPVVPDVGGPTEFVQPEYQFKTLAEAATIVKDALQVSDLQRQRISESVQNFSKAAYMSHFRQFVCEGLAISNAVTLASQPPTPFEMQSTHRPPAGRRSTSSV